MLFNIILIKYRMYIKIDEIHYYRMYKIILIFTSDKIDIYICNKK